MPEDVDMAIDIQSSGRDWGRNKRENYSCTKFNLLRLSGSDFHFESCGSAAITAACSQPGNSWGR
jgi:hypothetical protein